MNITDNRGKDAYRWVKAYQVATLKLNLKEKSAQDWPEEYRVEAVRDYLNEVALEGKKDE